MILYLNSSEKKENFFVLKFNKKLKIIRGTVSMKFRSTVSTHRPNIGRCRTKY